MSFHKNEVQQDNEDLSRLTEFICSQMLFQAAGGPNHIHTLEFGVFHLLLYVWGQAVC